MDSNELRDRSKRMAIAALRIVRDFPNNYELRVLSRQLVRSATSVAANYRAACRSRSTSEFYAKLCIVVEEADETLFWIELLEESDMHKSPRLTALGKEVQELLFIFSASRKTVKSKLKDLKNH